MQDLEEDPDYRSNVFIYKADEKEKIPIEEEVKK